MLPAEVVVELVAKVQFTSVLLYAPPPKGPALLNANKQLLRLHEFAPPPDAEPEVELPIIVQFNNVALTAPLLELLLIVQFKRVPLYAPTPELAVSTQLDKISVADAQ
jgi:hypothetical protein